VTDRLDTRGELANMLTSFLSIGVEQRGAGVSFENPVKLPDEISDVPNALAHALADKGRLLMGGIAGEEYSTAPPFPGDEGVKSVTCRTPQRRVIGRDPSGEKSPDLIWFLHLSGIFAWQQHDLNAKRLPCSARGAVAGDDVVRCDGSRRLVFIAKVQRHMTGRLIEPEQLRSQFDVDTIVGRGVYAQSGFDRRLSEDHGGGVTKRVGLGNHIDPTYQLSPGAKMLRGRKRCDIGQYALCGANIIQQAKDFVVDRYRARFIVDIALTVDGQRSNLPVAEQTGRDGACGAVTDHHNPEIASLF